jgi:hypothetical protein
MKLSLAIALFLAATFDVQAAPQPKSKGADANKIAQMVTVSGECTRLVQAGRAVEGCKSLLVNMNYSTGVSSYWFMTESTILSFSGDGSRRIEQGPNIVIQAIEKVILAAMGTASEEEGKEDTAWLTPKWAATKEPLRPMGACHSSKHSKLHNDCCLFQPLLTVGLSGPCPESS